MSFTPETLNGIFSATTVVGSLASAIGEYSAGKAKRTAGEINAQGYEIQSEAAQQSAALDIVRMRKNAKLVSGQQAAAYVKGGVLPTSGSPIDVMIDSLANAELDIAIRRYNGTMEAIGYTGQANQSRYEGTQSYNAGLANAGITLLKGAGSMVKYLPTKPSTTTKIGQ